MATSIAPAKDRAWLRVAAPLALGVIVIVLWQLAVTVGGVSDYLLPSPGSIASEFVEFAPAIGTATLTTGINALVGLVVGGLLGVALATLAASWRPFDAMATPIVAALAVVPIVALAPVLNSMFGSDSQLGRQTIAGLAAFVPIFVNTLRGLRQVLPVHRDLMRAYAASSGKILRTVTFPTAVPFIFTGVTLASSLAVISALVAEYFGGPRGGLGAMISTSAATSAYARAWAYVFAGILLGLLFYLISVGLEKLASRTR